MNCLDYNRKSKMREFQSIEILRLFCLQNYKSFIHDTYIIPFVYCVMSLLNVNPLVSISSFLTATIT